MAVTVNDLREQVIRLEAVCEEYVRDKDDFYEIHRDAYQRICGTIVCDFVTSLLSTYSYLNGLGNMDSPNISIRDAYREIRKTLDSQSVIWRKCHQMVPNTTSEDVFDLLNNLNILRDLRNIPVHEAQWGGILRRLSQDVLETLVYLTALICSCIDSDLDYARYFDIALNVYEAMSVLVYDE